MTPHQEHVTDRREDVARLTRGGWSAAAIARHLGFSEREQIAPPPIYDDVEAEALASDGLAAEVEAWLTDRSTR